VLVPDVADVNDDSSFGGAFRHGFILSSSNVTIQNLTINGQSTAFPTGQNFRAGIIGDFNNPYSNLVVQNVTVQNVYRRGIQYSFAGTGNRIINNTVTNVGPTAAPLTSAFGIVVFGG